MKYIKLKKKENVQILSIMRGDAYNALNRQVVDEIDETLTLIEKDNETRVLIIYSEKNFAAGADIKQMAECTEEEAKLFAFSPTFNKLEKLPIPTIALIEGNALGGGLELALACDMRIAHANAKLGFPEVNLGIMPGAGGTVRTPRLIGAAKAKELIFTGKIISADEALKIGLVNNITFDDDILEEGLKLAFKLSQKSTTAIRAAKKAVNEGLKESDTETAILAEAGIWANLFNTYDQKEGMRAFIEKRPPYYIGK